MSAPGSPQPTSPEPTPVTTRLVSHSKIQSVFESLSLLLGQLPDSITLSDDPSLSLLHSQDVAAQITSRLREPLSGAGDDNLCRWLYDTFHTFDPNLQLVVLRFLPTLCGVYLLRAVARKPLPGFEAVLLALSSHVTKARAGQAVTVTIPDVAHPSLYHDTTRPTSKNTATELHIAVVSPSLEPHSTVRATKRARIVGVALELYYTKISLMPVSSKTEFCEFCRLWAGSYFEGTKNAESDPSQQKQITSSASEEGREEAEAAESSNASKEDEERGGRIPLPWELMQPSLRILGHCIMGPLQPTSLREEAYAAIKSMHARAMHDLNPQAILATQSLLKIGGRPVEDPIEELNARYETVGEPDRLVVTTCGEGMEGAPAS